jgi:hypothetical protein
MISNRRSNRNFFDIQPTELIINSIVDEITCSFSFGFLIPNRHTAVVGLYLDSVGLHRSEFDELFSVLILFAKKLHTRVKRIGLRQKFIIDRRKAVFVVL